MVVFVCGGLLCFLFTIVVLRRRSGGPQDPQPGTKGGYELVNEQKSLESPSSKEKEMMVMKT